MKKILDVGCGTGNLLNYIAKRNSQCLLWGIDIEQKTIEIANKNRFCNRETFLISPGETLNFSDNFFDEIYCYEVLEHVNHLDKTLSEIKRVLKNNGKLFITVPLEKSEKVLIRYNPDYPSQVGHMRFFSKKKIRDLLIANDFRIISHITYNSMEHLFWRYAFKHGSRIINQLGELDKRPPKIIRVLSLALSRELFYMRDSAKNKFHKKIMGLFILFYPITLLLDSILLNKKQKVIAINEK